VLSTNTLSRNLISATDAFHNPRLCCSGDPYAHNHLLKFTIAFSKCQQTVNLVPRNRDNPLISFSQSESCLLEAFGWDFVRQIIRL
jgi:hypothetical protein